MKKVELTLPEWAFLDTLSHEGNPLDGRDVIMHIRSSSVLEVFDEDKVSLIPEAKSFKFKHRNKLGLIERKIVVVHYTFDPDIIDEIMKKAAKWYCDYLDWIDSGISEESVSRFN